MRGDLEKRAATLQATINDVALLIHYRDRERRETRRVITPLIQLPHPRPWPAHLASAGPPADYKLLSWCHARQAIRSFFLSRIISWDPVAPLPLPPRDRLLAAVAMAFTTGRALERALWSEKRLRLR